ncbi:hypothetical protein LTR66_007625 [Elasticomyces elasticus]|nr:hypothetical protein LTR66_007625 [Elasticomyces elasticus]
MAPAQDQESILRNVIALASLFSNCVEAFGMIHPSHKWEREEQLLLSKLGLQQARLLIWGDILGVSAPPASVATHAIPSHPSATYPDLTQPMYFGARDPRLDDPEMRKSVDQALNGIVDRSAHTSREEMMELYGLRRPKKSVGEHQLALDNNRLEAFREKYSLLLDVAEQYSSLTRRSASITMQHWAIVDNRKFANFVQLIRERVDGLVQMMNVQERVDRAMTMDIKALGWHLSPDSARTAQDTSKLRLIHEICKLEYPQYTGATQQALENLGNNWDGSNSYEARVAQSGGVQPAVQTFTAEHASKEKRPGFFSKLRPQSWRRSHAKDTGRSQSGSSVPLAEEITARSLSESAPSNRLSSPLEPARSKSVSVLPPRPVSSDEDSKNQLAHVDTVSTVSDADLGRTQTLASMVSRHDQYHGPYRVATNDREAKK